ncbi:AzlC family ABC transporter permease [Hoyosella rhizosphaerae]|uniref:Branched-chain amino acid ABC transporter permease n=1 Tax=Hoyosella rhizosphaerae TaxID=1755582 RepID=A0A916U102_9ACTN|nr:AzlC family ABC transporter permease [Hoyosella rhizosphaerae]GGC53790.1 branched-chain amino acid ABC transporter permease [Hoyosella rhizosphaerae]
MHARQFFPAEKAHLIISSASIAVAVGVVGVAYGAVSVEAGLPVWFAPLLGVLVLAASSEMLFVGLLASGGSPIVAAAAALTVNSRHLPYGLAVSDVVGRRWPRYLWIHLINDESVAFAAAQRSQQSRRFAYACVGIGILVAWPIGALVGSLVGQAFDVTIIGLDAVFLAVILALVISALRDSNTRLGFVVGVIVAVACAPWVPTGVAPLMALVALPLMGIRQPTSAPESRNEASDG